MTDTAPAKVEQTQSGGPAVWLGHTPTGQQLAEMDLPWFHQAVDSLDAETVPKSYFDKVVARRQAQAWEVR